MSTFWNDLRFALRTLRRSPSFTIAAMLALGLGTGSAAGVFSLLRGVVLRPLPYAQPDRLVMLWETNHAKALEHEPISPVNFGDYRALTGVFADAAAWWRPQINLTDDAGEPIRVNAIETTENLFAVLGVRPLVGSDFTIHQNSTAPRAQTIISHRLWQSRFAGDRSDHRQGRSSERRELHGRRRHAARLQLSRAKPISGSSSSGISRSTRASRTSWRASRGSSRASASSGRSAS